MQISSLPTKQPHITLAIQSQHTTVMNTCNGDSRFATVLVEPHDC